MDKMPPGERSMILTAEMDPDSAAFFTTMRTAHFPSNRNYLDAHITMFHAIPGTLRPDVITALENETDKTGVIPAKTDGVRFLGNGVAYQIHSPGLIEIRQSLATRWHDSLGAQDKQPFRPHITVQNKVMAETARALHERLSSAFSQREISIVGLRLWYYDGGPWEPIENYLFSR